MINAVGFALNSNKSITKAYLDRLLTPILAAAATCDIGRIEVMVRAIAGALGGKSILPENCNVLIGRILQAHTSCSPERMGTMIVGVIKMLGGTEMKGTYKYLLLDQVLDAHSSCTPRQMGEMVGYFVQLLGPQIVIDRIIAAQASPIKTGLMIASVTANSRSKSIVGQQDPHNKISSKLVSVDRDLPETAKALKACIEIGFHAGAKNIAGLLATRGVEDDEKVELIGYLYGRLHPLDETSMSDQLGMVMTSPVTPSLMIRTMSILLKEGPRNEAAFNLVRQSQIRRLILIADIEGVGATEFETCGNDLTNLYDCFKEHMTFDFIDEQRKIICGNLKLPQSVRDSIGTLLRAREVALLAELPALE